MKKCITCKIDKDKKDFYKKNNKCRACIKIYLLNYKHTKKGLISSIYNAQVARSKKRKHRLPEYTKKELQDWLFSQKTFHIMYSEWVNSNYETRLIPSVDRRCDYTHYCMSNIQLMTWDNNDKKAHKDVKSGKTCKTTKAVIQCSLKGKYIAKYHSISEANRQTGIARPDIGSCCNGKLTKAGGYIWKFATHSIKDLT